MRIAVGSENNKGIRLLKVNVNKPKASQLIQNIIYKQIRNQENIYIVCVGTDRSTGDSFAPFVGMFLEENGIKNIIGTIDNPCHTSNLDERLSEIPDNAYVIAIDACLGKMENIEKIEIIKGQLEPGKGVNKQLTNFGDLTITYNVNVSGYMEYQILQNTRLSRVLKGAKICANVISEVVKIMENQVNNENVRLKVIGK